MDGYEATRALRLRPGLRDLPVIAMTANAMAGEREKVMAAGMNDYIAKPINVDELFATLARWLRPQQARTPDGAAPKTAPEVDKSASLAALGGDEELYQRLLGMFREREAGFEARFRGARSQGDLEAALRCAHDLKSAAGTLGMRALQRAAEALEAALAASHQEAGDEVPIEPLLADVTRQLEPLVRAQPAATDG